LWIEKRNMVAYGKISSINDKKALGNVILVTGVAQPPVKFSYTQFFSGNAISANSYYTIDNPTKLFSKLC
jgi:hypothetical protein